MDNVFPVIHTWLPLDPIERPVTVISWERELAKIFAIHPEWLTVLRRIRADSLMTDDRFYEILKAEHRKLGARWRRR